MALCTDEEAMKIFHDEMETRKEYEATHPWLFKEYWFDQAPPDFEKIGGPGAIIAGACVLGTLLGILI